MGRAGHAAECGRVRVSGFGGQSVGFWPSWTAEHDTVPAPATKPGVPTITGPIAAGLDTSTVRGGGRVVTVTVAGAASNLVGSAQSETFLTQDVPAVRANTLQRAFWSERLEPDRLLSRRLLRHPAAAAPPEPYAAAASLSGYLDPGIHVGDGSEHTTYNTWWRRRHLPVPAVAVHPACARADGTAFAATAAIAKAGRNPLSLTTSYINGGGHTGQSWRAMEAPAFGWLSSWLGQPTTESDRAATPRAGGTAPTKAVNRTGHLVVGATGAHLR